MDNNTVIPVMVGLIVGIAFVAAFAFGIASLPPTISTSTDDTTFYSSPGQFVIEDDLGNIEFVEEDHQSSTGEAVEAVYIDFSPVLSQQDIVVKKGETVKVPIMIESDRDTEKVITLQILPQSDVPDSTELALNLDYESIALSKDNIASGKAKDNGLGRLLTEAGFLTVTASPTVQTGTYEYGLEANYQAEGGDGMGAGQLFRVTVLD